MALIILHKADEFFENLSENSYIFVHFYKPIPMLKDLKKRWKIYF